MTQTARVGDTVKIHYRGKLEDGSVFDSSEGAEPIEFTIGEHQVIGGLEEAIVGMTTGEKKVATIPPDDAYGEREDDLVFEVSRSTIQPGADVAVGDSVQIQLPGGQSAAMHIMAADDESITLDANHPLAGKTLIFDVELLSIG
jgi:FKBP-type peptidyl-prolyl cis-trans isomerase 2